MSFSPKIIEAIEEEIRAGRDPLGCGCVGCRDRDENGACPCGQNCRCKCTLPHRVEEMRQNVAEIERIRARIQGAGQV